MWCETVWVCVRMCVVCEAVWGVCEDVCGCEAVWRVRQCVLMLDNNCMQLSMEC